MAILLNSSKSLKRTVAGAINLRTPWLPAFFSAATRLNSGGCVSNQRASFPRIWAVILFLAPHASRGEKHRSGQQGHRAGPACPVGLRPGNGKTAGRVDEWNYLQRIAQNFTPDNTRGLAVGVKFRLS